MVTFWVVVTKMSRQFFRGYAFQTGDSHEYGDWMNWCGGGPIDNLSAE
jgi:hypothetical protein